MTERPDLAPKTEVTTTTTAASLRPVLRPAPGKHAATGVPSLQLVQEGCESPSDTEMLRGQDVARC